MSDLKPCPFCGSNAAIKKTDKGMMVVCTNWLCPCETFKFGTEKEAVDQWNRRADHE